MYISRMGVQVGDVIEDRKGGEWVLIGMYHDFGGNCQVHLLVRWARRFKLFARVKLLADAEFDKFQRDCPT